MCINYDIPYPQDKFATSSSRGETMIPSASFPRRREPRKLLKQTFPGLRILRKAKPYALSVKGSYSTHTVVIPAFAGMTLGDGNTHSFPASKRFLNSLLRGDSTEGLQNKVFSLARGIAQSFSKSRDDAVRIVMSEGVVKRHVRDPYSFTVFPSV